MSKKYMNDEMFADLLKSTTQTVMIIKGKREPCETGNKEEENLKALH